MTLQRPSVMSGCLQVNTESEWLKIHVLEGAPVLKSARNFSYSG
jgi:hypothetical protein